MQIVDIFSGIGGFSLAGDWIGWKTVQFCEINPFGQKVLAYHFPGVPIHDNIKTLTAEQIIKNGLYDKNETTILVGGVPCQPWSNAGKRLGKDDDRDLWAETIALIGNLKPQYAVLENVRGLTNWNGGVVFDEVQADLEAAGYEVIPFLLPACAVNAPHRRDRIWFVAYHNSIRQHYGISQHEKHTGKGREYALNDIEPVCDVTHSPHIGHERTGDSRAGRAGFAGSDTGIITDTDSRRQPGQEYRETESGWATKESFSSYWQNFPTESPLRQRDDGISNKLLRFVVNELYDKISNTGKENRIENLPEVQERIFQAEIWEQIRGFYSLESKEILLQTMQLYSPGNIREEQLSPFSEEFSKPLMQHLSKYGEFRRSPQGQKLEKQRSDKFGNALSFLPHEVALAAGRFEAAVTKFENWHRNESIKAYGNAIVPQVAFEIFKAIAAM